MGDILPTVDYPVTIRGSLRLILQLKDAFLGSFNLVEEYRDELLACKHGFTRDLVVYQLTKGLAAIKRLREDYAYVEAQAQSRAKRNALLREYLVNRYNKPNAVDKTGSPIGIVTRVGQDGPGDTKGGGYGGAVIGSALPPPINAPDSVEQALHGGLDQYTGTINVDDLQVPDEINLATTPTESGTTLLPVVDFYRGLYFLQMHFQLIMCQAANYALPVVTRPLTFSERAFAWPTMPSFGLASTNGAMIDRLLEIHSDVLALATRLHECLGLVREKMIQDRKIESYFTKHTAAQEALQRNLLRSLQAQRVYMEALEGQNDRLAGLAIKLDPNFAKSADFAIMTGPGLNLYDKDVVANQNSALTESQYMNRRPDTDDSDDGRPGRRRHDRDDSEGRGGFGRQPTTRKSVGGSNQHHGGHKMDHPFYSSDRAGHRNGGQNPRNDDRSDPTASTDVVFYGNDMNISASGGGRPAIWVNHGTLSSTDYDKNDRKNHREMDVELTKKIGKLRGHSQAVEELLIGVESVASGMGKLGADVDHLATPSFMNTDHYVTSMYDEVFGQIPNNKSVKKSAHSFSSIPRDRILKDSQNIRASSTNYSQAEEISPVLSTKQSGVTVSDSQIDNALDESSQSESTHKFAKAMNGEAVSVHHDVNQRFKDAHHQRKEASTPRSSRDVGSTENSLSHGQHQPLEEVQEDYNCLRNLDTNVNSSHVILPKLSNTSKHPLARIARTSKSTPPNRRIRVEREVDVHDCPPARNYFKDLERPTEKSQKHVDKYDPSLLRAADQSHPLQVPTVGSTECGHLCIPQWVARNGTSRILKPEDLLKEPKRSEFNKAVITHRCRLVETILQADEERLEELIALLIKE